MKWTSHKDSPAPPGHEANRSASEGELSRMANGTASARDRRMAKRMAEVVWKNIIKGRLEREVERRRPKDVAIVEIKVVRCTRLSVKDWEWNETGWHKGRGKVYISDTGLAWVVPNGRMKHDGTLNQWKIPWHAFIMLWCKDQVIDTDFDRWADRDFPHSTRSFKNGYYRFWKSLWNIRDV